MSAQRDSYNRMSHMSPGQFASHQRVRAFHNHVQGLIDRGDTDELTKLGGYADHSKTSDHVWNNMVKPNLPMITADSGKRVWNPMFDPAHFEAVGDIALGMRSKDEHGVMQSDYDPYLHISLK